MASHPRVISIWAAIMIARPTSSCSHWNTECEHMCAMYLMWFSQFHTNTNMIWTVTHGMTAANGLHLLLTKHNMGLITLVPAAFDLYCQSSSSSCSTTWVPLAVEDGTNWSETTFLQTWNQSPYRTSKRDRSTIHSLAKCPVQTTKS